jgi:hypothetical protein
MVKPTEVTISSLAPMRGIDSHSPIQERETI